MSNITYLTPSNGLAPAEMAVKALSPYDFYVTDDEFKPILGTLEQLKQEFRSLGYEIEHVSAGTEIVELTGVDVNEPEHLQVWVLKKAKVAGE